MNSLADQLNNVGLVSTDKINDHKKKKHQQNQSMQGHLKSKFKGTKGIVACDEAQLDIAKTVNDFKHVAKRMLFDDPNTITTIIQKAHEFRDRTGNKKIIWFFYSVRDGLKKCPSSHKEKLLKRMFRRNNPKFKLPE